MKAATMTVMGRNIKRGATLHTTLPAVETKATQGRGNGHNTVTETVEKPVEKPDSKATQSKKPVTPKEEPQLRERVAEYDIDGVVRAKSRSGNWYEIPCAFLSHTGGPLPFRATKEGTRDFLSVFYGYTDSQKSKLSKAIRDKAMESYSKMRATYEILASMARAEEAKGVVKRYTVARRKGEEYKWSVSSRSEFKDLGSLQAQLNNAAVKLRALVGRERSMDVIARGRKASK